VLPEVELPVVPDVPVLELVPELLDGVLELELDGVLEVVPVVDEPLAPMPLVLVLLLLGVVLVVELALGEVVVVVLSRPDVRVVVVDEQPAARAQAAARAMIESDVFMELPSGMR
jgi:hypothetical protein